MIGEIITIILTVVLIYAVLIIPVAVMDARQFPRKGCRHPERFC